MGRERGAISSALHTIRYPSGETEYRMSEKTPAEGDILTRNGDNWVVEEVREADDGSTVVTLRPRPRIEPGPDGE